MVKMGRKEKQKGFTLVEVMVVVAILGILAASAVPSYSQCRGWSYASACLTDSRNACAAAQGYFLFGCDQCLRDIGQLYAHGFRPSDGVTTVVVPGKQTPSDLVVKSTHDASGVTVIRSLAGYTAIE